MAALAPLPQSPPRMAEIGQVDGWRRTAGARAFLASPLGVALFAAVASLALRLPTLGLQPPWGDEVITLNSIALSPRDLMVERMHQMHSPTFFWFLQLLGVDGRSLFWLRLPSALADSAGAALTALVAYRLGGWRAAIVFGCFYAAMPVLLEEAQDARPNAMLCGFLGLYLWSAARLVEHPRLAAAAFRWKPPKGRPRRLRGTWIACGLAVIGMVNMLPLGFFAIAAVDLAVLWKSPRLRQPWLIQRGITLLLLTPLLYGFLKYVGRFVGHYWYSNDLQRLLRTLADALGGGVEHDPNRFLGPTGHGVLLVLFLSLAALGLLCAKRRASLVLLVALALGAPLLLIAVSQHTSLYVVRYFAIATPALTVLAALGVAALLRRSPAVGLAAAAATIVLLSLNSLDAMQQLGKPRFDLAVARLRDAGVERLVVHVENRYYPVSVLYYLQDRPRGIRLSPWAAALALGNGRLLWVVDYPYGRIDPTWRALSRAGAFAVCEPQVPGLKLLAVARDGAALRSSCPDAADLNAPGRAAAAP